MMNSTVLMQRLIAIERSIGTVGDNELRDLVRDAEDCALEMQSARLEPFCDERDREVKERLRMLRGIAQNRQLDPNRKQNLIGSGTCFDADNRAKSSDSSHIKAALVRGN